MRKLTILFGIVSIAAASPANATGFWDWLWLFGHHTDHGDHTGDTHDTHHG